MESLSHMAVFARVVDAGGFSAAAQALGLSKSAVSKRVAQLEDRLGARLLNRTTRRLALTDVGRDFYERCRRILAEVEEAEASVSRLHTEPRGTLRVNAPMSFGVRQLAPILPAFLARHSRLAVEMILNDRVVDVVEEGFDLAVRIVRLADSSLIARRLAPFRRVVCASPAYWARRGRPERPEDLRDHDGLIYTYLANPQDWPFRGPDGPLRVRVRGQFASNNGDVLRTAACAGLGVYLAPTFIVGDDLAEGRLETALEAFEETDLGVYAVYPPGRHLSAKVRAFIDYLAERFGPTPPWEVHL